MRQQDIDIVHSLLHDLCARAGTEPGFIDMSELSNDDKAFILITTCAELQGAMISIMAGGNRELAEFGVDLLIRDLKRITLEEQRDKQRSN